MEPATIRVKVREVHPPEPVTVRVKVHPLAGLYERNLREQLEVAEAKLRIARQREAERAR